jgi:hypothetical protein
MTAVLDPTDTDVAPAPPRKWVRALLGVIVLLIAAMWVYAFVFASKDGVYRVDDDGWRRSAERICAEARDRRIALVDTREGYIANPTPEQMIRRADVVDRATDILDTMLDDIDALPTTSARDGELVDSFLGFYRTIISDRRAYTARLRQFDLQPYRETLVGGGPVTNVVTDFTSGNDIKSCVPPGELGGDT